MSGTPDADLYAGYADWKQWRGDCAASDSDARCFAGEFAGIPLSGRRVLEIGFGNGRFLGWARSQGAVVAGTEIDAGLISWAQAKGFDALPAPLDAMVGAQRRFDVVVAFDVFEHWSKAELVANLRHIHALLEPDGVLVARFPNGQSPFGRVHQYGDITHQTVLSSSAIEQLAGMTGFAVVQVRNAQRVPARSDPWSRLKFRWRRWRRARIERALGKLYGYGRLPLDPNLTAVLRRIEAQAPTTSRGHA